MGWYGVGVCSLLAFCCILGKRFSFNDGLGLLGCGTLAIRAAKSCIGRDMELAVGESML